MQTYPGPGSLSKSGPGDYQLLHQQQDNMVPASASVISSCAHATNFHERRPNHSVKAKGSSTSNFNSEMEPRAWSWLVCDRTRSCLCCRLDMLLKSVPVHSAGSIEPRVLLRTSIATASLFYCISYKPHMLRTSTGNEFLPPS
jgi:hypothetical protein